MPADGILERRLQKLRHKKDWRRLFCKLVSTAIVVYLLFGVIFGIAIVQGDSMTPAVRSGDIVFFLRLGSSYNLGDIVLIRTEGREDYVKRVCALPGQTVEIDDEQGRLLVDGEPAIEPYAYSEGKMNIFVWGITEVIRWTAVIMAPYLKNRLTERLWRFFGFLDEGKEDKRR